MAQTRLELNIRQLQLLLFSAERALAHSHALKAASTKQEGVNHRKEQLSFLRRALAFSASLYDTSSALASSSRMGQKTLAEVTIYHLSITSELSFERSQWADTLASLAARRRLLATLASAARNSVDQALATEFIDAYDPLIRFSAYKLGRAESHDIEGVVKDVDEEMMEDALPGLGKLVEELRKETDIEAMEQGRKELEDVTFAGDSVELRSAEIVGVMLKVQEALKKADGSKGKGMARWDRVLSVLGDAEGVARKLLDDHEVSVHGTELRTEADPSPPAPPARFDRPGPPNPFRSHINTSSSCSSPTESSETCFSLTRFTRHRWPFPPTQRCSGSRAERSSWRRRSRAWRP